MTSELVLVSFFFFFNDTATTEIYTLSLHDALPISAPILCGPATATCKVINKRDSIRPPRFALLRLNPCCLYPESSRSEEHTSELQSQSNLVCRLLLEKKKKI